MFVQENIKTKIQGEYDVAVCGGGFAGISAALAAIRQGKKQFSLKNNICLVELVLQELRQL